MFIKASYSLTDFRLLRMFLNLGWDRHIKKHGTFRIFLTPGVWRNPTNRITKSPRNHARAFQHYSCRYLFSRQTSE